MVFENPLLHPTIFTFVFAVVDTYSLPLCIWVLKILVVVRASSELLFTAEYCINDGNYNNLMLNFAVFGFVLRSG